LFAFHQSDGGRTSRRLISPAPACASESEPPSELQYHLATARERGGPAAGIRRSSPAAPPVEGYGSRRKRSRPSAICRRFFLETAVTAYLIALALAGLIAIVTWEAL
jgi:hypothetical protein